MSKAKTLYKELIKFPTSPIEAISELSYVYDEFGNWTEFRQYRNGQYNCLRLRKILYK